MSDYIQNYLIGSCDSGGNGIIMTRIRGTERQIKQHLLDLVLESKKADIEHFDYATETIKEIEEESRYETDGTWQACAVFSDYHIDFTATPEPEPEVLQPKAMTKKDALALAKEIIDCIDHITTFESPDGSGYFTLAEHHYVDDENPDENMILQLAVEVCKYKDDSDGHLYYGVYNVPEVAGGDSIADGDWLYTDHCRTAELANALLELEHTFTEEYLWKLYEEYRKNL